MFTLLRYGWEATVIYGVDPINNKFLIFYNTEWTWVSMDEFIPVV